jgi:hypothetical protein
LVTGLLPLDRAWVDSSGAVRTKTYIQPGQLAAQVNLLPQPAGGGVALLHLGVEGFDLFLDLGNLGVALDEIALDGDELCRQITAGQDVKPASLLVVVQFALAAR